MEVIECLAPPPDPYLQEWQISHIRMVDQLVLVVKSLQEISNNEQVSYQARRATQRALDQANVALEKLQAQPGPVC
jgi:hypothetical protein